MPVYNRPRPVTDQSGKPSSRTRTEGLFQTLKLAIVRGSFQPGDRLTEEAIATRFAVSRTPVRECFRRLEQEGLLSHLSFGSYTVRSIDLSETSELYEVRVALEEVSVERLCRTMDCSLLADLDRFWSAPPAGGTTADINLVYADEEFHETLALAGGSRTLYDMLKGVNERLHVIRTRDFAASLRVGATYQQHYSILQAVQRGDSRLAVALVRAHILESQAYVEAAARTAAGDDR